MTVAICTFNRAELLRTTLAAVAALEIPRGLRWDLLIVNNNCTDHTNDVCASFAGALPLRVVFEPDPGLSSARNRALRESSADCIVFTDDDVLFEPRWLASFVEAAERWPRAAAFGGPIAPYFPVAPDPDLLAAFPILRNGFCGVDHQRQEGPLEPGRNVFGANMAYRRALINGLEFNTRLGHKGDIPLGGEDIEFLTLARARGELVWCPDMRVRHYVDPSRMTLAYMLAYHVAAGEKGVRRLGIRPGIFGAPRWLWTACVETYVSHLWLKMTGRRRAALERLRDHSFYRGMLQEARVTAPRPANPSFAPEPAESSASASGLIGR